MSADPIVYCLEQLTDYRQFERLCSDVMSCSGYEDIEPLGGSNDGGRDALHVSRINSDDLTIFAYSVRADWRQKLINEDCSRIFQENHKPNRVIFVSTTTVTSTQRDAARKEVFSKFGWELEIFDLERLRVNLAANLRHLIAQHPAIFCPPFFPTRGGISIAESRDTILIDHHHHDHALATWLTRRLQLEGYRTWCYGTAPLAGETADDSIRLLINRRARRYLPILSQSSVSDADFVARCSLASGIDNLVIPCEVSMTPCSSLPNKLAQLNRVDFGKSWSFGLKSLLECLSASGVSPDLDDNHGRSIALRSYVPETVILPKPEFLYTNTFALTLPAALQVCKLKRPLSSQEKQSFRQEWAFVEASATELLAFEKPPATLPLTKSRRLPQYAWRSYDYRHGKRTVNVIKELTRRSLDVVCCRTGLRWCDDRRVYYFERQNKSVRFVPLVHVDGRKTRVGVTGEQTYGSGDHAKPFRYQLCPKFRVGYDEAGDWWVTLRIYVRITDQANVPYQKKGISRRRKKVGGSWWNKEWFARTLAIMQFLGEGGSDIVIGSGAQVLSIRTRPLQWECPVSIDYLAVERIGDFQEEMAQLRYVEPEDDLLEEEEEESDA